MLKGKPICVQGKHPSNAMLSSHRFVVAKKRKEKGVKKKSKSSMYAADRACDKTNEKSKEQEQIAVKMASVQMRLNRTTVVEGSTEGKASCDCLAEESKLVH